MRSFIRFKSLALTTTSILLQEILVSQFDQPHSISSRTSELSHIGLENRRIGVDHDSNETHRDHMFNPGGVFCGGGL